MSDTSAVTAELRKAANFSIVYILGIVAVAAFLIFHGSKWQPIELLWVLLAIPLTPRIIRAFLLFGSLTRFIWIIENVTPIATVIETQYSWYWDDLVIKFQLREFKVKALIVKSWSRDRSRKGMVDVVDGDAAIYIDPNGGHAAVIETDNGFLFVHCQF